MSAWPRSLGSKVNSRAHRSLLMVRRVMVDRARIQVLASLQAEAAAVARVETLDEAQARNDRGVPQFTERNQFLDIAASHHARFQEQRRSLVQAAAKAKEATADARTVLMKAMSAAEAFERWTEEQATAGKRYAARREQHALDDMARSPPATHKPRL